MTDLTKMSVEELVAVISETGGSEEVADELARRLAAVEAERDEAMRFVTSLSDQCGESCASDINAMTTDRDNWKQRAEALEAVVAKLPKTADGKPVVPGVDAVWYNRDFYGKYCDPWELNVVVDAAYAHPIAAGLSPRKKNETKISISIRCDVCYSTPELARAAAEREASELNKEARDK